VTDGAGGAVGGVTDGVGGAVGGVGGSVDGVTGGVDSLLNGGSLLDANVDINADADLTAPVAGAVAANANVAAPINASVAANIGSDGAVAQSLADQQVDIHQNLDDVSAEATADQDANIEQ
jgi:phage-related protein